MRTAIANLPLHYGKTRRCLFDRMAKLGDREKLDALRRLASWGEMTKPRVTTSGG